MRLSRRRLFGLTAAALQPIASARAAAELRVLVPALPQILDPHFALTPCDRAVASETFLGLVARDAAGAIVPGLAERWTESPDGSVYTFNLRPDARWSDGAAITAQDVAFSFARALNPAFAAPFAPVLGRIAGAAQAKLETPPIPLGVQAVDRNTVRITLTLRSTRFLASLTHPIAAIVPRAVVSRVGAAWVNAPRPVCSGPFVPVDQGARLERNANAVLPAMADAVQFEAVDSFETAADRIRRGTADLALGFAPEPVTDRATQRILRHEPAASLMFVAVNMTRAKLGSREVRHGLGMMIERERLIRALRLGDSPVSAAPAYAPVPPDVHTAPEPHPAPYRQIEMDDRRVIAEVLLQEENIVPSQPTTFRFLQAPGRLNAAIVKTLGEAWAKMGIRLDIHVPAGGDYGQALMTGDFDLALASSKTFDATAWPYLELFSRAAGPDNLPRYGEDEFESQLGMAAIALEPSNLSVAIGNAEGVLAEDQIVLPLFAFHPAYPVANGIGGWEPNPRGIHPLRLIVPRT